MFSRLYDNKLAELSVPERVLLVFGARQVGKTTLVRKFAHSYPGKVYWGVGEDAFLRKELEREELPVLRRLFGGYDLLVLDEAQRVRNVGMILKLIIDNIPGLRVIATGSSSFDLSRQVGEPLTGRKTSVLLFPLSVLELVADGGAARANERLEEMLIYGAYPECLSKSNHDEKIRYLVELRDSLLFKDILELDGIRNSRKLIDLLMLIAFQIGSEVSLSELGRQLALSSPTVARYLDLLEKAFIVKNIRGYSRNLRKEITKTSRYYFLDNGVRNAVVNNFNPLTSRNDQGQLWENFAVIERFKRQHYLAHPTNFYFWRTHDQQEIDLVEERAGELHGYEMKYDCSAKAKIPSHWKTAYPEATFTVISPENIFEFVT